MKRPTEEQILVHLVDVAQVALDAGDSGLARQLVLEAYTGFNVLRRERDEAARQAGIGTSVERTWWKPLKSDRRASDAPADLARRRAHQTCR